MAKAEPEKFFPHLRYATLSDVRKELPSAIGAWIVGSIFFSGIIYASDYASDVFWPSPFDWTSLLPRSVTIPPLFAIATWFLRGQSFHVPRVSFGVWLVVSLDFAALVFLFEHLPLWLMWPFLWGHLTLWNLLESLDARGRENFEAIEAAGHAQRPR